ncbi:MAG: Hsp70 family protein [Planctomycetes bacterium]|nr:Hsp70 family protein [Planctomycetota bacterium]
MADESTSRDPILGIDLGTTNSLVALCDERGPRVLVPAGESPLVPSVVRYIPAEDGWQVMVGDEALRSPDPARTLRSIKRLMGRSIADIDLGGLSYQIVDGPQHTARVRIPGSAGQADRIVTPQEVSAEILRFLAARAQRVLGVAARRVVITVPAYFDDAQRQATRDAGRLAGLDVVRIVNEPTAAGLAYGLGLDRSAERNRGIRTVAVYDFGGGTFDISILSIVPGPDGGSRDLFRVIATAGDTALGGDDIDHALLRWVVDQLRQKPGPEESSRLRLACIAAKHHLSTHDHAVITWQRDDGTQHAQSIALAEFDSLITPIVERTIHCCDRALADAQIELEGVAPQVVALVGGSTRIPLVRRLVAEKFALEPYSALDPDQVVALGAAVQGAVLSGSNRAALLLDVVPLSLGLETAGGGIAKIIVRNAAVPARATEMFSTQVDNQTGIHLRVFQGEREMAADCRLIADFHLRGIPPMPAGIPQVEVTFLVDANGVLNVSAIEKRSGRRAAMQVVPNHGLTREEVDQMERASVVNAKTDMHAHRIADLVVNSKLDLKWISERLAKLRQEIDPAYARELDTASGRLAEFLQQAANPAATDADAFARAKHDLDQLSVRLQEVSIAASLRAQLGQ